MAVPGSDQHLFDLQTTSKCYVDTVDEKDKAKVIKARLGQPSAKPASKLGQVAWYLAKRLAPAPSPPVPPPVVYKKVAPRTYNYAPSNNSDPRFCVHGQPGVRQRPDGLWEDESGALYDNDGRDTSGRRSRLTQVPGLRQADNSDGRGECEFYDGLTAWPGDPTKNTGSWEI